MWTSLRNLGSLTLALVLGSGVAYGGDLSNVTVGRFQDFTVVTLFGEGPLSVTHQIVEAKDGKPHRIVVDVTGALHRLPQNNFVELPEGSITAIRTSQFAVSPEPVVRVVLDLAHPAAYRLESPEGQIRLLVSLPGDPAMATTWSAREGTLPATGEPEGAIFAESEPATDAATATDASQPSQELASADPAAAAAATAAAAEAAPLEAANAEASQSAPESTEPAATESTSETSVDAGSEAPEQQAAPAEAEPKAPATTSPTAAPASGGVEKALPLAATGALAANEAASNEAPASAATAQTSESSWDAAAPSEQASSQAEPAAESAHPASADAATPAPEAAAAGLTAHGDPFNDDAQPKHADASASPSATASEPWSSEQAATEVPLPDPSKSQPERVIDYNLPVPASIAAANETSSSATLSESHAAPAEAEPAAESASEPAGPKMAVKSGQDSEASPSASAELPATTGTDAAATDVGSAPLASLSTLPPIVESAEALMPERKQIIYHTHGKRDPFKALLTAGGYSAAALPDVSTLRLVGVLQDVMESWGLFEDANGYGYILRKGDRVKNGSLTQLTNNRAYFNLTEFGWSRSVHIDLEPEG